MSQFFKTKEETENWLISHKINNYTINEDLSVDVDGDVNLVDRDLKSIPIQFGKVEGNFYVNRNELTSLKGCAQIIGGSFSCYNNQLTSLEGCPKKIGGSFDCSRNNLTSLEGCPKKVGGDFDCSYNAIESLEHCPNKIGDGSSLFNCQMNSIESLKNCPDSIRSLLCGNNKLKTFEHMPSNLEYFGIQHNPIKTIEHLKDVGRVSFEYVPGYSQLRFSSTEEILNERDKILIAKEKSTLAQAIESPKSKEQNKPRFKI